MLKKIVVVAFVIGLLAVGATAAYAQGGGKGPGGPNEDVDSGTCLDDPQLNTYNNGGVGSANTSTGARRNGQQRSQMNAGVGSDGTGFYASLPPAYEGALPQEVIDLMIAGWTDEQHAYDVYESVIEQFGAIAPFTNIQQAEVQHAAAWEFLFDRYGITMPDMPDFDTPTFVSAQEACALGAEAEIANFSLYDQMLATFTDYPDIYQVALALRNASEFQHLPAFQTCAAQQRNVFNTLYAGTSPPHTQ